MSDAETLREFIFMAAYGFLCFGAGGYFAISWAIWIASRK
jgi:hypothetical protein